MCSHLKESTLITHIFLLDTCSPRKTRVNDCHVIEGGLTIKIEGNANNVDEMLPILFESVAIADANIIDVEYLENITLLEQIDKQHNARGSNGSSIRLPLPISVFAASCMAMIGALGTVFVLFFGRTKGPHRSIIRYENESSLPATTSIPTMVTPPDQQGDSNRDDLLIKWPNPFIIAEEEETAWQSLGILPMMSPQRLEPIREEVSSENDDYYDERSI